MTDMVHQYFDEMVRHGPPAVARWACLAHPLFGCLCVGLLNRMEAELSLNSLEVPITTQPVYALFLQLSKGKTELVEKLLDEGAEHKDMVRDEYRRG